MANEIVGSTSSDALRSKAQQEDARRQADQAARNAAARSKAPGSPDPTATERAAREEMIARAPKAGSSPEQRAGWDPLYQTDPHAAQGVQSSRNASQAGFDKFFNPVDWAGTPATHMGPATHMAGPSHMPSSAVQPAAQPFAGDIETQSALGITPGGTPNVPRRTTAPSAPNALGWPHVDWTGPSLLPQVGPGGAPPFVPGQQGAQFHVPIPLTGPRGTPASDAAALAANKTLAAPGGASGLWSIPGAGVPTEYGPYPRLEALTAAGGSARTPYGPIAAHMATHDFSPVDWAGLRDTSPMGPDDAQNIATHPASYLATPGFTPGLPTAPIQPPKGPVPGVKTAEDEEDKDTASSSSAAPQMDAYSKP